MNLRVLIADDEPLARERLRRLLEDDDGIEVVGEATDGKEAVRLIYELTPDLVFLDVQMPEMDGFGVLQELKGGRLPAIVFVTAYDHYALRAFEASALDYLVKPFARERLNDTLRHARDTLAKAREHKTSLNSQIAELLAELQPHSPKPIDRLSVKSGGRILFVKLGEIGWIQGAGNYAELHVGKINHLLRETLQSLEERLPADKFIRIGRSILVNFDHVRELLPKSHGDYFVVLQDGTRLTASRAYRGAWQHLL